MIMAHFDEKLSISENLAQVALIHLADALTLNLDMPTVEPPEHIKLISEDLQPNGKLLSNKDIALLQWYFDHCNEDKKNLIKNLTDQITSYLQTIVEAVQNHPDIIESIAQYTQCENIHAIVKKKFDEIQHTLLTTKNQLDPQAFHQQKTSYTIAKSTLKSADHNWKNAANKVENLLNSIEKTQYADITEDIIAAANIASNKIISAMSCIKKYERNTKTDIHSLPGLLNVNFSVAHLENNGLIAIYKGKKHPSKSEEQFDKEEKVGLLLGLGAFGKVKLAQNLQTGELIVDKVSMTHIGHDNSELLDKALQEMQILTEFNLAVGSCARTDSIHAVHDGFMKLIKDIDLFTFVKMKIINKQSLSPQECYNIIFGAINAVRAIHAKGYVHRDIKGENLIYNLKTGIITAIDLRDVIKISSTDNKIIGTFLYKAPELKKSDNVHCYTTENDIYSLGVMFGYYFGLGMPSLNGFIFFEPQSAAIKNNYMLNKISYESRLIIANVIKSMLAVDPLDRILLDVALERLSVIREFSPFISNTMDLNIPSNIAKSIGKGLYHDVSEAHSTEEKQVSLSTKSVVN